jgi:hypothetical protein
MKELLIILLLSIRCHDIKILPLRGPAEAMASPMPLFEIVGSLVRAILTYHRGTHMDAITFPAKLTVQVTDVGLVELDTAKWTKEFVVAAVQYACRIKIDQKRNAPLPEGKTEQHRRDAIQAVIDQMNAGEWSVRATAAAKLDETEKQLRLLLVAQFVKAKVKPTEAQNYARGANRWELFRDLVMKPKIMEVATAEELPGMLANIQQRVDTARHTLEQNAENRANAIMEALKGMEVDLGL